MNWKDEIKKADIKDIIDSIKEIEYNDDIFSKIVMKEDKKNILNILIKNYD